MKALYFSFNFALINSTLLPLLPIFGYKAGHLPLVQLSEHSTNAPFFTSAKLPICDATDQSKSLLLRKLAMVTIYPN